jgi:hypothetical protein
MCSGYVISDAFTPLANKMLAECNQIERVEIEQYGLLAGDHRLVRARKHHFGSFTGHVNPLQIPGGVAQTAADFQTHQFVEGDCALHVSDVRHRDETRDAPCECFNHRFSPSAVVSPRFRS